MAQITVNGTTHEVDAPPEMPLLWVIRDLVGLTGTRFGCGRGLCGACTVHVDGIAMRGCTTPLAAAQGRAITTIEGLGADGLHPLQKAWIRNGVPQCGFCQSGQLMQAAAFLELNPTPTEADVDAAMAGNICRCGTYTRIRQGILEAAAELSESAAPPAVAPPSDSEATESAPVDREPVDASPTGPVDASPAGPVDASPSSSTDGGAQ